MSELTPQQVDFIKYYNNPDSETYNNAYRSAIKAGFSEEYAQVITSRSLEWMSESVGRRKRMLNEAERKLEKLLGSDDEKIQADIAKFVAKTIGKKDWSERQEVTGADGKELTISFDPIFKKEV